MDKPELKIIKSTRWIGGSSAQTIDWGIIIHTWGKG